MPIEYKFKHTRGEAIVYLNNQEHHVFASNPTSDMRSPKFHVSLRRDKDGKKVSYLRFYAFGGLQRLLYHGSDSLRKIWTCTMWDEGKIGEVIFYADEQGEREPLVTYPIVIGGTGRFTHTKPPKHGFKNLPWGKVVRVADGNPGFNDYRIHVPQTSPLHQEFLKEAKQCGFDTVISAEYKGHLKWHRINIWVSTVEVPPKARSFKLIVSPTYSNKRVPKTYKNKENTVVKVTIGIAKIEGYNQEEFELISNTSDYKNLVMNGSWMEPEIHVKKRILMTVNNYMHFVYEARLLDLFKQVLDPKILEKQIKLWASAASDFNHNLRQNDEALLHSQGNTQWDVLHDKLTAIIQSILEQIDTTTYPSNPHMLLPHYTSLNEIMDFARYLTVNNALKLVTGADIEIRKYCYQSLQATLSPQLQQGYLELESNNEFTTQTMLSLKSIRLFLIQAMYLLSKVVNKKITDQIKEQKGSLLLDVTTVSRELEFPKFSLYYLEKIIDPSSTTTELAVSLDEFPEVKNMIFTLPHDFLEFYARIFLWYAQSLYSLKHGELHKYYFYLLSSIFWALTENFTLSQRFLSENITSKYLNENTLILNKNLPLIALELEFLQFKNNVLYFLSSSSDTQLTLFDDLLYWNQTFHNQFTWILQHNTIRELSAFNLTVANLSFPQIVLNNVIFPRLLELNTDFGNQIIYAFLNSLFLLFNSQQHVEELSQRFLSVNPETLFKLSSTASSTNDNVDAIINEIFIRLYRINVEIIQAYSMIFVGRFNDVLEFINGILRKLTGLLQFTMMQKDQNINRLLNDFLIIEEYVLGLREYVTAFLYNKQVSFYESLEHLDKSIASFEKVVNEGFPHDQLNPFTVHANIILWLLRIYRDSIKAIITEEEQYASIVKKNIDYLYLRSIDPTIKPLIPIRVSSLINKLHGYLATWVGTRQISNIIEVINEASSTLVFPFAIISSSNLIKSRLLAHAKFSWLKGLFYITTPWAMNHVMNRHVMKLTVMPDWENTSDYDMIELKLRAYTLEQGKLKVLGEKSLTKRQRIHKENFPRQATWKIHTKVREDFTGKSHVELLATFSNSVNKDLRFTNPPFQLATITKLNTKPIAEKLPTSKLMKYLASTLLSFIFSYFSYPYLKEQSTKYIQQLHLLDNLFTLSLGVLAAFLIFFILFLFLFNYAINKQQKVQITLDEDLVSFTILKDPFELT